MTHYEENNFLTSLSEGWAMGSASAQAAMDPKPRGSLTNGGKDKMNKTPMGTTHDAGVLTMSSLCGSNHFTIASLFPSCGVYIISMPA